MIYLRPQAVIIGAAPSADPASAHRAEKRHQNTYFLRLTFSLSTRENLGLKVPPTYPSKELAPIQLETRKNGEGAFLTHYVV